MQCISEGEEHKEYESGDKAFVIRSAAGVIPGTMSFRNEYDHWIFIVTGGTVNRKKD